MKKFTLQDKVAVVTGAARGLGYNMAQALSQSGAKAIAILDMRPELGAESATELQNATGLPVKYYNVDIRDEHLVSEVVANVVADFGSVDVLINSAGIAESNIKAETYSQEQFAKTMNINVIGNFLVAQAVGRHMIQAGHGGSVIFIASMSGTVVNYPQEQSAYNASKAAVIQLSKSLAAEWAKYNIRVNSISPGYMDTALNRVPALDAQKKIWTDLTPQRRLGAVDELNNLAVFLASDASAFMTGSNLLIDGGYSVL
jgi:NAD(P)-dependent dehydrogenase (short-subunit alcohol dehydrogenase family)